MNSINECKAGADNIFSPKEQRVGLFGFVSRTISATTSQLYLCCTKATTGNMYLQKQAVGWISPPTRPRVLMPDQSQGYTGLHHDFHEL